MQSEKKPFANVDELMPQVSLEQAARFYGVELPELKRIGSETRTACFLACGKTKETGDRALAIQSEDPFKKWHCHQYGCGKGSNLIGLCDLMKPGSNAGGGPVRGQRFKEIRDDLVAMVSGQPVSAAAPLPSAPKAPPAPKVNPLLKESDNERARGLTELDRKFVVDIADMSPAASAYFRRRPYLTPEVCRSWRLGYLPRDVGGQDKSGGTMRGKITYAYLNDTGAVLSWFGRDPEHEDKHAKWEKTDKQDPEPQKFHFVKGFHRGIELFGTHALQSQQAAEKLRALGWLPLVEGPNDVIRLSTLDVPALGLCSNRITREQAEKLAALTRQLQIPSIGLLLDCDEEGLNGMRQCLGYIAQVAPVRLLWTDRMFGGKFKDRQPESLSLDEWRELAAYLSTGTAEGWSLSS